MKRCLVLVLVMLLAGAAQAVTVLNHSFELPEIVPPDTWNTTFVDWIEVPNGGGPAGVNNDPFIGMDGLQKMYASRGSYVYQILTETVAANMIYELTALVGMTADIDGGYQVQLVADGVVLAEDDSTLSLIQGAFQTSTVTFASGAAPAQLGKALEIYLRSGTADINFDKVQLIPEPATMLLFGLGGLGLIRRKRS